MKSPSIYTVITDLLILNKDFAAADELLKTIYNDSNQSIQVAISALLVCGNTPLKNRDMLYQQTKKRLTTTYGEDEVLVPQ